MKAAPFGIFHELAVLNYKFELPMLFVVIIGIRNLIWDCQKLDSIK